MNATEHVYRESSNDVSSVLNTSISSIRLFKNINKLIRSGYFRLCSRGGASSSSHSSITIIGVIRMVMVVMAMVAVVAVVVVMVVDKDVANPILFAHRIPIPAIPHYLLN